MKNLIYILMPLAAFAAGASAADLTDWTLQKGGATVEYYAYTKDTSSYDTLNIIWKAKEPLPSGGDEMTGTIFLPWGPVFNPDFSDVNPGSGQFGFSVMHNEMTFYAYHMTIDESGDPVVHIAEAADPIMGFDPLKTYTTRLTWTEDTITATVFETDNPSVLRSLSIARDASMDIIPGFGVMLDDSGGESKVELIEVWFSPIPEPSFCAAFFGAIALALCIRRRR